MTNAEQNLFAMEALDHLVATVHETTDLRVSDEHISKVKGVKGWNNVYNIGLEFDLLPDETSFPLTTYQIEQSINEIECEVVEMHFNRNDDAPASIDVYFRVSSH